MEYLYYINQKNQLHILYECAFKLKFHPAHAECMHRRQAKRINLWALAFLNWKFVLLLFLLLYANHKHFARPKPKFKRKPDRFFPFYSCECVLVWATTVNKWRLKKYHTKLNSRTYELRGKLQEIFAQTTRTNIWLWLHRHKHTRQKERERAV